jgi:D-sedoheptulose 7-phosphate isomerase
MEEFQQYLQQLKGVLDSLPLETLGLICDVLYRAYEDDHMVFIFGNGGSAALASHLACDLGKGTHSPRVDGLEMAGVRRLKVFSVTDNVPMITAWANDAAYDDVFAEQIENFIGAGDVAFAISGSGNSRNVLKALNVARGRRAVTVGMTGFKGGKMKDLLDYAIVVPCSSIQQIEDTHLVLAHLIYLNLRQRITQRHGKAVVCSD